MASQSRALERGVWRLEPDPDGWAPGCVNLGVGARVYRGVEVLGLWGGMWGASWPGLKTLGTVAVRVCSEIRVPGL